MISGILCASIQEIWTRFVFHIHIHTRIASFDKFIFRVFLFENFNLYFNLYFSAIYEYRMKLRDYSR